MVLWYFRQGQPVLTRIGTCVVTTDSVVTWTNVLPGEYTVALQMVNNDNMLLSLPVIAHAKVIVPLDVARFSRHEALLCKI